jgi:glycosyltransferase involved in cell wall biosynthesis
MTLGSPLVSVVISSYTMERIEDIRHLLDQLRMQTYANLEVVFVAERDPAICDQVKAHVGSWEWPQVQVYFNDGAPGLSGNRNLGVKSSSGDVIAFIDDDAVPFRDWAERIVAALEEPSVIGVTGPAFPLWDDAASAWLPEELYWLVSCTAWTHWTKRTEVRSAWGMNMAFWRKAFDLAGDFGQNTGWTGWEVMARQRYGSARARIVLPEDLEFSLRVRRITGKKIIFDPGVRVWHKVYPERLSSRFIARRAFLIGQTRPLIRRLCKSTGLSTGSLEEDVLKRLVMRLLKTMWHAPRSPGLAWRQFYAMSLVLLCSGCGYLSGLRFCLAQAMTQERT